MSDQISTLNILHEDFLNTESCDLL